MKDVKRYRCIGEMVQRSKVGGGLWVSTDDFDAALSKLAAETLRADTAEAERESLRELLREAATIPYRDNLINRIYAAINPKPEAGSQ